MRPDSFAGKARGLKPSSSYCEPRQHSLRANPGANAPRISNRFPRNISRMPHASGFVRRQGGGVKPYSSVLQTPATYPTGKSGFECTPDFRTVSPQHLPDASRVRIRSQARRQVFSDRRRSALRRGSEKADNAACGRIRQCEVFGIRVGSSHKPNSVPRRGHPRPGRRPFICGPDVRPLAIYPEASGGPPSSASLFDLAPGGVYRASPVARGTGALLPHRFTLTGPRERGQAVCFLLHFPSRRRASPLESTLPCGVRTFLRARKTRPAAAWSGPTLFSLVKSVFTIQRQPLFENALYMKKQAV